MTKSRRTVYEITDEEIIEAIAVAADENGITAPPDLSLHLQLVSWVLLDSRVAFLRRVGRIRCSGCTDSDCWVNPAVVSKYGRNLDDA